MADQTVFPVPYSREEWHQVRHKVTVADKLGWSKSGLYPPFEELVTRPDNYCEQYELERIKRRREQLSETLGLPLSELPNDYTGLLRFEAAHNTGVYGPVREALADAIASLEDGRSHLSGKTDGS